MAQDEIMTAEKINATFDSEWVLVGNPELDEFNEVVRGKVLFHSRSRREVLDEAVRRAPLSCAILFTGRRSTDDIFIL